MTKEVYVDDLIAKHEEDMEKKAIEDTETLRIKISDAMGKDFMSSTAWNFGPMAASFVYKGYVIIISHKFSGDRLCEITSRFQSLDSIPFDKLRSYVMDILVTIKNKVRIEDSK